MVDVDQHVLRQYAVEELGCHLPLLSGDALLSSLPTDPETYDEKVYLEFPGVFGKLIDGAADALPIGQAYALSCDAQTCKKQVVSTDSDLLTPAVAKEHEQ